jgi:hypothetical protein
LEITGILRSPSEAWNHKFNLIGVSLTKPFIQSQRHEGWTTLPEGPII